MARKRLDVAVEEPTPRGLRVPRRPTVAVPGSREKIAVMSRRHADGELLHHPADLRLYAGRTDVPDLSELVGKVLERIGRGRYDRHNPRQRDLADPNGGA